MRIDPNDLALFARLWEAQSFTRAADQLGVPKSTLSRRMSMLERSLGERILQRTTRRMVLTEFGLRLLEHARLVWSETEAVVALAENRQLTPHGILRISMPNDFAHQVMAPLMAEYMALYPEVRLEIDLSPRRVDVLAEGFDLAIRFGDLPDDAYLASKAIYHGRYGLYAAPQYLDIRGAPQHPRDLEAHRVIELLVRSEDRKPWSMVQGSERWEGSGQLMARANSPELLVVLAKQGLGVINVPADYAAGAVESGELIQLLSGWSGPQITGWAVFPGRRLMPLKTRKFLDLLEERL